MHSIHPTFFSLTWPNFKHQDNEKPASESSGGDLFETSRPYLCTGFDIYLVWEPCTMYAQPSSSLHIVSPLTADQSYSFAALIWRCAMALVHHRFKRVFYAFPNPVAGALGGVYRLHGERSLNHHYNVFRVSVPEAYLNGLNCYSKECWSNTFPFLFRKKEDPTLFLFYFWHKGFILGLNLPICIIKCFGNKCVYGCKRWCYFFISLLKFNEIWSVSNMNVHFF